MPATPTAHCTRCSIPGYRCIEEETRIRRGIPAITIAGDTTPDQYAAWVKAKKAEAAAKKAKRSNR